MFLRILFDFELRLLYHQKCSFLSIMSTIIQIPRSDIIWGLFVEFNIQQRVVWIVEKASLKICYIILFECKGL